MKRKMKQITVVGLFACALTVASLGAMHFSVASADTEPTISLIEGASLRLEETNGEETVGFGMRFKTMLPKSWLDAGTEDTLVNPVIHTILLPTDMLTAELTAETAEIGEATILAEDVQDMKYSLASYPDYYIFNTVLTQMSEEDYSREISVRSYVTADNLSEPIYSPLVSTYATTARSVVQVANAALSQDITYNTDYYSALEKYLITGIDVAETRNLTVGTKSNVRASLAFNDGVSDTVKAHLTEKYAFSYTSDDECVTVNKSSGTLTVNTVGTANITVSNETLGFEKTVAVTVTNAPSNIIPIAESNLVLNQYQGATVETYNSQEVVAISINSPSTNVNGVGIKLPYFVNMDSTTDSYNAQYFTLSIDYLMVAESSDQTTNWRIQEPTEAKGGLLIKNPNDTGAYSTNLADAKAEYVTGDGEFKARVYIQENHKTNNASATFYITEIKLDIADLGVGDAFSWANYGIATDELSNVTFNGTAVADLDTFNPTAQAGTLAFTATKDGVSSTHTMDVKPTYGTLEIKESNFNLAQYQVATVETYNYKNVVAFSIDHTGGNEPKTSVNGVGINLPSYFNKTTSAKYLTLDITYLMVDESNSTDEIDWYIQSTSSKDKLVNKNDVVTYSTNLADATDDITNKGVFKARIYIGTDYKEYSATATFYITEIKLGFADLAVGDAFSWANYGIAVSELSNVTFNGAAVTDLDTFNPTAEAGALTFTVNKDGYAPTTFTINVA
ncbi:MAG: hypothetical protein IJ514_03220 [Clostridia bacterium]|nr:hypothetical protein [Clostridia bacterium]